MCLDVSGYEPALQWPASEVAVQLVRPLMNGTSILFYNSDSFTGIVLNVCVAVHKSYSKNILAHQWGTLRAFYTFREGLIIQHI